VRQQLTEQTRYLYHLLRPPFGVLAFQLTLESNNTQRRASTHTPIREFTLDKSGQVVNPVAAGTLSATAYFFGRELHERFKVPIGLVVPALNGSPTEA
jgi:hypothetical protein